MKLLFTKSFRKEYAVLPTHIQALAEKKLGLLLHDSYRPSLRIKKMEGSGDIWEGRITQSYRFTFHMQGDTYILRRVGSHDMLKNP